MAQTSARNAARLDLQPLTPGCYSHARRNGPGATRAPAGPRSLIARAKVFFLSLMAKIKVSNPRSSSSTWRRDLISDHLLEADPHKLIHPYPRHRPAFYFIYLIEKRDYTNDQITVDAAEAIKKKVDLSVGSRHHHARRGGGEGGSTAGDVSASPNGYDPQHPRRRPLPRAHRLQERAAPGAGLDAAVIIGRHAMRTNTVRPTSRAGKGSDADLRRRRRLPKIEREVFDFASSIVGSMFTS